MTESIKTALEHESYSAINSIRELSLTLHSSVSRGISVVEKARRALAAGEKVSDIELDEIANREDWVDTRCYDLFPTFLRKGAGTGREMLALGTDVDGRWARCWAKALGAVARLEVGDKELLSIPDSVSDQYHLSTTTRLFQSLIVALIPSQATEAEHAALTVLCAALSSKQSEAGAQDISSTVRSESSQTDRD